LGENNPFAKGEFMKFLTLVFLSFSAFANHENLASCVFGNHNSQHFRATGFSADDACQKAKAICEDESGMICFEIDREEGYGTFYDGDYDGSIPGDYDNDDFPPVPGENDGDGYISRGFNNGGYDDWTVINGHRVNQVVCKVPMFSRHDRSVIRREGRTPREACQKALRACQREVGPRGSCGRPQVERNYRR
jgi:hypothetical protein